jgi:hypothetical protein
VNDPPAKPAISWDSKGLRIEAANSSLNDILKEVAAQPGIKVEGFEKDQRIYGVYGPGRAHDVLTQLLEGTGYNVLMFGEQAPGTPRQIVLSARSESAASGNPQPGRITQAAEEDEDLPEPVNNNQPGDDQPNQGPLRPGYQSMPRPPNPLNPGQPAPQPPQ